MSNKLRLEMSFKVVHLESDPNFADGWYLDVLERLVPGGTPRTTRYGPMATPDFLQALADDLCNSAERIMQNAVKAMRKLKGADDMTRLDDIRARLAAITPGPWGGIVIKPTEIPGDYTAYVTRKYLGVDEVIAECFGDETTPAKEDAEFIAAAPDDMRFLLAENERLRASKERLQAENKRLRRRYAIA